MARRTTTWWAATAVAALLLAVLGPLPVRAVPTWLPEETVSGPAFESTLYARIAVDPLGNATAVWSHSAAGVGLVRAAHRPAGGTWSAPLTISDPDRFAQAPDVVVDPSGTVTAAWMANTATGKQIESARLPVGGSWSSPALVGAAELAAPRLAVDDAGTVTAVWLEYRSEYIVRVSSFVPGGGWTVGKDLSDTAFSSTAPQVAVDPATGHSVAVWQTFDGTYSLIKASRRPAGGAWSSPQLVSEAGENATMPQVTIDGQGTATVLFGKYFGHYEAFWSSAPQIGPWSMPQRLSTPGDAVPEVAITSASSGETVAAWSELAGGPSVVWASTRPSGGSWSAAVPLSVAPGGACCLSVGDAPDGTAYVLWRWTSGSDHPLQLAKHPPGGGWSAPLDVAAQTASSIDPAHSIGFDDDGDLAVVHLNGSPSPLTVAVRALDVAGPVVSMAAPAKATAGKTQAYAATASDHWSPVDAYRWVFGDGTTASGPNVSHTYANPGSYAVTLTVTDAVGNATTRTATTAVVAPVPAISVFKLTKTKIQALARHGGFETVVTDLLNQRIAEKTKLKVRLSAAATLKVVFKSKHKHLVKGKKKYLKVVLKKKLPAGASAITIKAKVAGKKLKPDTYVLTGSARNTAGSSAKKKAKLVVVAP